MNLSIGVRLGVIIGVGLGVILSHFDTNLAWCPHRYLPTDLKNEIIEKNIFFHTCIVINVIQFQFQHDRTIGLEVISRTKLSRLRHENSPKSGRIFPK